MIKLFVCHKPFGFWCRFFLPRNQVVDTLLHVVALIFIYLILLVQSAVNWNAYVGSGLKNKKQSQGCVLVKIAQERINIT